MRDIGVYDKSMSKLTGRQLLRRAAEQMGVKGKKARRHRATQPGIGGPKGAGYNPLIGADLGGANSMSDFRGGQKNGNGGPNVGDWPYNGRQDARKPKRARKTKNDNDADDRNAKKPTKKGKKYSHKGHTHQSRKAMKAC